MRKATLFAAALLTLPVLPAVAADNGFYLGGSRTPWTLSSEDVWNKTNRMGGKMLMLFGLIIIISPYLPQALGIGLFVGGILLMVFGTLVYSFWLYKKENENK